MVCAYTAARVDQRRSTHHAHTQRRGHGLALGCARRVAWPHHHSHVDEHQSLRYSGQAWFEQFAEPRTASLMFALCGILVIFAVLVFCHRRRWMVKL
jgi:hypothetical protein